MLLSDNYVINSLDTNVQITHGQDIILRLMSIFRLNCHLRALSDDAWRQSHGRARTAQHQP